MHMSKPHLTVLLPWVVLLVFSAGCRSNSSPPPSPAVPPPPPANAWAIVNGHTITQEDVDKAYRRTSNAAQVLSDEETMTAKLSLLNDLIVQELLLARAGVLKVEVHALGFSGDLYGRSLRAHFVARLRDELKFDGIEPLRAQIDQDKLDAARLLATREPDPAANGAWH